MTERQNSTRTGGPTRKGATTGPGGPESPRSASDGSDQDPVEAAVGDALLAAIPAQPKRKRKRRRKRPSKAAARKKGQIDIGALLQEPLHVLKGGKPGKIDPLEAAVRKQVQKALKEKSLAAIKEVVDLAIKHRLVVAPPEQRRGGVLVIPKTVPDEVQEIIFSHPGPPMSSILKFLEWHYEQRSNDSQ